jgi:hypothetical protein
VKSTGPASPQIAIASDDTVFVAYLDRKDQAVRLFVTKSADGGATWDEPTSAVRNHNAYDAFFPTIQIDDIDRIHLSWHEADRADESPRRSNVYYTRSTDGGMEFDVPTRLNTQMTASAFARFTLGGSASSLLAVSWSDFRNGQWDIMVARSDDSGVSWEELAIMTNHSGADFNPDVLVTVAGELHLVWHNTVVQQNMPISHVMYMRSLDFGENWSKPSQLSPGQGRFPQWVVKPDSGAATVFWLDEKNFGNAQVCPLPARCSDVALTFSVDSGNRWEAPEMIQYEGHQNILSHSATFLSDGRPVVVWSMQTDSSREQRVFVKVRKSSLPL